MRRSIELVSVVLVVAACGGKVADETAAPNGAGADDAIAGGAFAPTSQRDARLVGDWRFAQKDAFGGGATVGLHLTADGRAGVTAEERWIDDDDGGRYEKVLPKLRLPGRGRTCTLGERWGTVDGDRLGLLFECRDGSSVEAVFSMPSLLATIASGTQFELALESAGGGPVRDPSRFSMARQ